MEEINYNKQSSKQENLDSEKGVSNNVNEPEVIYETQQTTDFVMPQEWIDEAEEASRRLRSGEDKGHTVEEMMAWTKDFFKSRHNIDYDRNNK